MASQVGPRLIDLKTFPITIFFCLLLCKLAASESTVVNECLSNYTKNINDRISVGLIKDIYQVNLQSLFNNLSSTSASAGPRYYNTSAGEPPNRAYGMYVCGAPTYELCHPCVTFLINSLDPENCKMETARTDYCFIVYAHYSIWTILDELQADDMPDKLTGKISQVNNQTLEDTIEQIALFREAAEFESTKLSDIFEALVNDHGKIVYVLAAVVV